MPPIRHFETGSKPFCESTAGTQLRHLYDDTSGLRKPQIELRTTGIDRPRKYRDALRRKRELADYAAMCIRSWSLRATICPKKRKGELRHAGFGTRERLGAALFRGCVQILYDVAYRVEDFPLVPQL